MKIALVCHKYLLNKGGLERYTFFLSRELLRAGHEVHVFANQWQTESGIVIHRVPMIRLSSPVKNLSFAFFAKRMLTGKGFDIIHSMERTLYQDIFRVSDGINPIQIQQNYENPLVRRFKRVAPRRQALSWLEHRIFEKNGCRTVMTNSELVKRHILEYYKVSSDKIRVIHNAVDTARFNPSVRQRWRDAVRQKHGLQPEDLVILFAANDFKLKRLSLVVNALALLQDPTVKLLVVGSGNKQPYLKQTAEKKIGGQVFFLGHQKAVEKFFGAADLFVLPTRYDAFANVCLEAMACGLPVITTNTNGAAELIRDDDTGHVLKSVAASELARIMKRFKSVSLRQQMGRNAAARAAEFTTANHMNRIFELYESLT